MKMAEGSGPRYQGEMAMAGATQGVSKFQI